MSGAPWTQVWCAAAARDVPALEEALQEAGAGAISLLDPGGEPVLEPAPDDQPLWPTLTVQALLPPGVDVDAFLARVRARSGGCGGDWQAAPVAERAWERAWMDEFRPMRFGRRLWIVPTSWDPPEPGAANLRLDPGLAFGTGTHPSTALCLEWLDTRLAPGSRVLDYGCGSGVLALAALRLGAAGAQAVDLDPQALTATASNAVANDLDGRLEAGPPDAARPAQVVLANIVAGTLTELAPRLASVVEPGGRLVLSGILEHQAEAVRRAYPPGLVFGPPRRRDGWVLLEARSMDGSR